MRGALLEAISLATVPALVAVALLTVCTLVGLEALPARLRPRQARLALPLALSIGTTLTGLVVWLTGTLLSSRAALPLIVALAAAASLRVGLLLRSLRRLGRELALLVRATPAPLLAALPLLALAAVNLLLPLVDSDGLRYHVALPKLFLLTGKVFFYPWDVTGAFPQSGEMLTMAALQVTRGEVAKLIHFLFFLASLVVLVLTVHRRRGTRRSALLAPLLFAASPVVIAQAPYAFVDHLSLFHVATAVLLASRAVSPLLVGAALAGALATKYTAAPAVVAVALYVACRAHRGRRLRALVHVALPVVVALAPFAIRNVANTGDPLFPIGYGLIGRAVPGVSQASLREAHDYHAGTPGLAGITWDVRQGPVQPDEVAGAHNLLAIAAAVVAAPYPPARALLPPFLAYAAVGVTYRPPTRYLLPMLWCLAGLGALAASRWLRRWAFVAVAVAVLPGITHAARLLATDFAPFDYLGGALTREELVIRWAPGYRAARVVNRMPPGGTVMALDFPAPYYLDRPWIVEGVLNEPPLARWARAGLSADELLARLQSYRVRYLLVTPGYGGGTRSSLLKLADGPDARARLLELRGRLTYLRTVERIDIYEVPTTSSRRLRRTPER